MQIETVLPRPDESVARGITTSVARQTAVLDRDDDRFELGLKGIVAVVLRILVEMDNNIDDTAPALPVCTQEVHFPLAVAEWERTTSGS